MSQKICSCSPDEYQPSHEYNPNDITKQYYCLNCKAPLSLSQIDAYDGISQRFFDRELEIKRLREKYNYDPAHPWDNDPSKRRPSTIK